MAEIITATFQDGAFAPEQPTSIPAGTRVRLTVQPVDQTSAQAAIAAHRRPTPEEVAKFNELCDDLSIHGATKMTRDELHERR